MLTGLSFTRRQDEVSDHMESAVKIQKCIEHRRFLQQIVLIVKLSCVL